MRNLKSLTAAAALVVTSGLTGCFSSVRVAYAVRSQPTVVVPSTARVVYEYTQYPDVIVDDRRVVLPPPRFVWWHPRWLRTPPRPLVRHANRHAWQHYHGHSRVHW